MGEEQEGQKKESKLHDIKETASDSLEILRELASEDVRDSLSIIKDITGDVKEMMQLLDSEAMRKNIENMRLAAEAGRRVSASGESISKMMKDSGIIDEGSETIRIVKAKLEAIDITAKEGNGGNPLQSVQEVLQSIKEMNKSISELSQELKSSVRDSKENTSGIMHNTIKTADDLHRAYESLKS